jgi:hypothetical protein
VALQTFTAGQVLTAAQVTALQANDYNQTVNNYTDSRVLTIADLGDRVVMNKATATTITVNTGIFAAGDTLWIHNIGAGVTTITAGTATVSTSGSLALAQNQGGTLYFTSTGVAIFFPSVQSSGTTGLVLLNTTSFSGVATQSISSVFSTTYKDYMIQLNFTGSTDNTMGMRLRSGSTDNSSNNYYSVGFYQTIAAATPTGSSHNLTSYWWIGETRNALQQSNVIYVHQPFETAHTTMNQQMLYGGSTTAGQVASTGSMSVTTSYDGFTLYPLSGTITGSISVYGFNK